ncbi:MAG: hypothetical protein AAFR35_06495 [Pseudomonadota bacterium]
MAGVAASNLFRNWGFWAVLSGAVGLALVFYQIGAPMTEPKPSVGTQIGEIAGDMRRAAWRSFLGLETAESEVVAETPGLASYLAIIAPVLGVIALVLSLISGVKGENYRYPVYGACLGAAAVLFQFFWWLTLVIAGVLLLIAIIENLGDFFGGGWFGG